MLKGFQLNFEDMAYRAFHEINSPEQLEAYYHHVESIVQLKAKEARFKDFAYDYYVLSFREDKPYVDEIIKTLLGPIPTRPSSKSYSNSQVVYLRREIGRYFDLKTRMSKNRNLQLYQAYAVHECTLHLASSLFLNREDLDPDFEFPGLFLEIYWLVQTYRAQKLFQARYSNQYPYYCHLLTTMHRAKARDLKLNNQGIPELLNLLAIYLHCGDFPEEILKNQKARDFLWKKLDVEEENSPTIAAWIRNIAPEFSKLEFTNPDSTLDLCYQFYDQILAILEESERKKSLVDIGMYQEQYMKLILGDPKLHGKGKDNKLEIGSAQSIDELYTQLHQHFEDHKPDPLRDDFYQFFGEVEKYDEDPVRIQNHQIYQEIGETSSWDDMLDIISTYEKGAAPD